MLLAVNATIPAYPGCCLGRPGDAVKFLIVEPRNPRDEANTKVRCVTEAEVIAAVSQLVHEGYEYIRVTDSTGTVAADVVVRETGRECRG